MAIWVWYRNFMKDEQGTWITEDLDENPGIRRLDWVIQTAEKYDMYVSTDICNEYGIQGISQRRCLTLPAITYCHSQRAALKHRRIRHDFFLIANHSSR